ncbi:MAG: restriction endonuclease subunit S [Coleofasciculus chthonoplastes F3-SA18-01]|uniref:restriction endonuclease subunit S n=1 Tax=Coleofasciculus chthonoplastes TaxID=64178 RepID=UPI0032F0EF07
MSEFEEFTLGDFISLQRGKTYKSALLGQPGAVLIGLASIEREGGFRKNKLETYGGDSPEKISLKPGDLYVSLKDITQDGHLLGAIARLPDEIQYGRLTQDTVKLIFKREIFPKNYIYWLLRTPQYRKYCRSRQTGTTNLGLSREDFLSFPVPPITDLTNAIVIILESIEKKIENLRKQNDTLEAIAQTLFKHWFVDFEFPNADGKPYKSSGGAMEPSELGEIPAGWRVGKLGDFCTIFRGSSPRPITSPVFFKNGTIPWIKIADATKLTSIYLSETKEFCTEAALPHTRFLKKGSLILSNSATVGIPMILNLDGCIHDGWLSFKNYKIISRNFLFFVLTNKLKLLTKYADGTVQKKLNTGILKNMDFIVANENIIGEFTVIIQTIFDKILVNEQQIQTLTKTRDVLLPKLMSGQIRIGG